MGDGGMIELTYSMGEEAVLVQRTPAADAQRRLRLVRDGRLSAVAALCRGISPGHIFAFAVGMLRESEKGLAEAAGALDAGAIADARKTDTSVTRASEVLVANLDVTGERRPSKPEARELAALAEDAAVLGQVIGGAWGRRRKLSGLQALVRGRTLAVRFDDADTFDAARYERSLGEYWLHPESSTDAATVLAATAAARGEVDALPEELGEADARFAEGTGASLLDFLTVIRALSRHPVDVTAVFRDSRPVLVAEIVERTGVTEDAACIALDLLTTDIERIRERVLSPGSDIEAGNLMRWRPLVRLPDGLLLYSPSVFGGRLQVSYVKGALSGSWPVDPPAGRGPAFRTYLTTRRNRVRPVEDFENRVAGTIAGTRLAPHAARNVAPETSAARLGVEIGGEIDAVAADPATNTVWVISAKDSAQVLTTAQVKNQLQEFYGGNRERLGSRCHVAVLHRRVREVARAAGTVASRLGAPYDLPWEVRGLFVTRIPSPAAADERRTYPVILLGRLHGYLEAPPGVAPERAEAAVARLAGLA